MSQSSPSAQPSRRTGRKCAAADLNSEYQVLPRSEEPFSPRANRPSPEVSSGLLSPAWIPLRGQTVTSLVCILPGCFPLTRVFGLATPHVALPGLTVSVSHQQFWFNCDQVAVRGQTSYVLSQSTNRDRYQHYLSDLSLYVLKCQIPRTLSTCSPSTTTTLLRGRHWTHRVIERTRGKEERWVTAQLRVTLQSSV